MSKFIGRKVEAAINFETSRGVGRAPVYSLGKIDFSLFDKTVDARVIESLGHIADSHEKFVVEKYAQGELGGDLGANSALYLLALAFGGTPSVGSATDSVYPWTLSVANTNQHLSGALTVKDGNQTLMYKLLMLEKFEMSVELEDLVKYAAEFVAKRGVTSTQSIPTYQDDKKFTKRKAKIYLADAVGSLGAATALNLKSFKFTVNKNLMRDSVIGTVEPKDILNQALSIEGEMELKLEDQTYRNYMLNGTKKALRISLSSENLIGASTYGSVTIDLPRVDFFSWEPDASNDDIVNQKINFKANYDITNGIVYATTVSNALDGNYD